MSQINLVLPEPLQEYVESRVTNGEFSTPSDFIRTLIRRDREQRLASLEGEMLDALSGGRVELSPEEVAGGSLVTTLKARLAQRRLSETV